MKAKEANLLQFLKASPQFVIPIYQRTYSWTRKECQQLWTDVIRAGVDGGVEAHFVGSVVYIEHGIFHVTNQPPLMVIDGQQRLTTVTLLLEALARHLGDREPADGLSAVKIRSYYLQNPLESGDRLFKLLLTQNDRDTLNALVRQQDLPDDPSRCVQENFAFFDKQVKELGENVEVLWNGLRKLVVVDVALARGQDNPQLIFESMNSTGRELSQADHIRNFVLMGLEPENQANLYNDQWHPMEQTFGQAAYGVHFDRFMRDYLTVKTGDIPNIKSVYDAFKVYAARSMVAADGIDALVRDVRTFAGFYCAMALGREKDPVLARTFQRFRELNVDVAYPFLLDMYRDYAAGQLAHHDFVGLIELIESYVFRRMICAIPTNSLNKTFAALRRAIRPDRYVESVQAAFQLLPSYRRFPTDDEFRRELVSRDIYRLRGRGYLFRRLENHGRKEPVPVDEYTLEHIMPQNDNLSPAWQTDLGPDWQRVHAEKLHTLGNLTLTGYNSEYSDRPFREKRDMPGGFRESPLRLNAGLRTPDVWSEATIDERAARLATKATQVWPAPAIPAEVLNGYRATPSGDAAPYTFANHPHLTAGGVTRKLFDALSEEVLALDPCVFEDIRKVRIAFKAETNIVDVVPQAARLVLFVNVPFHELNDPKAMARDVTKIGRWGVGPAEVGLDSIEHLPYVMGLIRQALERQLGEGDADDPAATDASETGI